MPRRSVSLFLVVLALAAPPAMAATDGSAEALDAFVRARLAEEAGNPAASLSALRTVSSLAPGLPGVRGRMLEQAIQAGDFDAARSAAAGLWDSGDRRSEERRVGKGSVTTVRARGAP